MTNSVVKFFKAVGRRWFLFLIIIIIIIYFYSPEVAIWMTVITLIIYLVSYIPSFFSKNKLISFIKDYYMIEDDSIAEEMGLPLSEVRQQLFELTQRQAKKPWLIIFLNKRYVFIHEDTIHKFTELYNSGYDEKEMLEELKENDLRTKQEVKAIRETLKKLDRLGKREISVQERRDKKRFE